MVSVPATRPWPIPEAAVPALLTGAARRWGERTAYRFPGHSDSEIGFAGLLAEASRFAHALLTQGLGKGDVVACLLPNTPAFPIAYYGSLLAGTAFAPFDPMLPTDELAERLADCGASVLITSEDRLDSVAGLVPARVPTVITDIPASTRGMPATPPDVAIDPDWDLAHIAFTGGTTGQAKGVLLTHRAVTAFAVQYGCVVSGGRPRVDDAGGLWLEHADRSDEFGVRPGEELTVMVTPWFHAMGLNACLNLPLLIGMTQIVPDRFTVPSFLADLERFSATMVGGAPAMFSLLTADSGFERRDLSSIRSVFVGAAPLSTSMHARLLARWPDAVIREIYGMTEATGITSPPWRPSDSPRPGVLGPPVPHTELKLVAPEARVVDDTTPEVGPGETGEVCVRGPQVMRCYLGRPAETAQVLGPDGWLRTGDIGVLEVDGLALVDRKKDVILHMGYTVHPGELEEILKGHPDVRDAAVVGRPDARAGEVPTAFVVGRTERLDRDEIARYLNARVAPSQRVRRVHVVSGLPMSPAGKVLRAELRERAAGRDLDR